jgi:hypothetical protein
MMSRGDRGKRESGHLAIVARCGKSWPIAQQHYRGPHHGCFFEERHRAPPWTSRMLWWLGDPVVAGWMPGKGGHVAVISPSPHDPSPSAPPPSPLPSFGSPRPAGFGIINVPRLRSSRISWPLASLGPSRSTASQPILVLGDLEKVSGPCQINIVLSSSLLRPGSLPFPILSFLASGPPSSPSSPQSRPNPMRVPPGVDACANPSQDPS